MAAVSEPGVRRWTVDEYERLATLLELDRVELIDGVIYDVSPHLPIHAYAVKVVYDQLLHRFADQVVMPAGSVRLEPASLWEPDVYVLDVAPDTELGTYPIAADVLLAVEISVTTWRRDTKLKLPVYARDGVPEVWVLRPTSGTAWELLRCIDPEGDRYRTMTTVPLPDGPGTLPAGFP